MANFGLTQLRLVQAPRQAGRTFKPGGAGGCRPRPRRRHAFRHARRCTRRLQLRARDDRPRPRSGKAGQSVRESSAEMAPRLAAGETVAWCSAASAMASTTMKWRSPIASSRSRSIPPLPRSISRRRCCVRRLRVVQARKRGKLPFAIPEFGAGAEAAIASFFCIARARTGTVEFFRPPDNATTMQINLRNIFAACSRRSRTSRRFTASSSRLPKGARDRRAAAARRRGGRDAAHAFRRARLAAGAERARSGARLRACLRRNPTEAERALWQALVNDRRFAGRGFKRQRRSARISATSSSFPLRLVSTRAGGRNRNAATTRRKNALGSRPTTIGSLKLGGREIDADLAGGARKIAGNHE